MFGMFLCFSDCILKPFTHKIVHSESNTKLKMMADDHGADGHLHTLDLPFICSIIDTLCSC